MAGQTSFIRNLALYALLALTMLFFIGPILWFMMLAIRPPSSAFAMPPEFTFTPTANALIYTMVDPGENAPQAVNSMIVAIGAVVLNLPFSVPAAYSLSRFKIRGKKYIMLWYLGLLMAPPVAFLIPYFILMKNIGLSGSYLSMVLVLQTLTIPFSIWLMKSFIDEVPFEIEEAARVDGASYLTILTRIILPLVIPGLVVTSMFAFVFAWNNAAFPLVLSSQKTATLPIGTLGYFASTGVTWSYIASAAVVAMLPPMIIFLVFDKYVVRGLTFGALKG